MTKHYKSFFLAIFIVLIGALIILGLRPLFPQKIPYEATIYRYARLNNLEPALVFAVVKTESGFDPDARSHKDARGLMQITEETLKWVLEKEGTPGIYTAEDLYDPEINIKYGCKILSLLSKEFKDDATTLAAYNAGRGNVQKWLKDRRYSKDGIAIYKTPYRETNNYIKKVENYRKNYRN